ncbi:MAG TPA: hypothetical protein VM076_00785 [Gemmatimonadaceae bacterium]|nr:hypothetical protein [Gemmatimonadaceae bacterium]
MNTPHGLALAALFTLAACNPFHRDPVSEVHRDVNANSRWQGSLVTPAALAGAVQIRGTASMQPSGNGEATRVAVSVSNATPGGLHPWQLRRGQCGADQGAYSTDATYPALKIGDDGRGEAGRILPGPTPEAGDFFVTISASAANMETIVACGNLAPPAR